MQGPAGSKGWSVVSIKPKKWPRWLDATQAKKLVEDTLDDAAKEAERLFLQPVTHWKDQPTFEIRTKPNERVITTRHRKYIWTNNGTRRHIIRAKRRALRFSPNSIAKTEPRNLRPYTGMVGAVKAYAKFVRHPGTKARRFNLEVKPKARTFYVDRLKAAMKDLKKDA